MGFPPSNPGDVLVGVGFVEGVGPELDWDPTQIELTWLIYDLVSTGEMDIGGGLLFIGYVGGILDIVADPFAGPGHTAPEYGFDPPNATSPGTFWDGEVYLHGEFINFIMTYDPNQNAGHFEGDVIFTGGTELDELAQNPEGYTVAGTVDSFGAPVPDGYDLEAIGHITFDPNIPTQGNTWGQVKNLYR